MATAAEQRAQKERLRTLLSEGKSEAFCMSEMGILRQRFRVLKAEVFSDELEVLKTESAAETWVRYKLRQENCIEQLDMIIMGPPYPEDKDEAAVAMWIAWMENSTTPARVSAIKTKSQLIDSILDKGQELGVLPKGPKEGDLLDGVEIENIDTEQLKKMAQEHSESLESLQKQQGLFADYTDGVEENIYLDFTEEHPELVPAQN